MVLTSEWTVCRNRLLAVATIHVPWARSHEVFSTACPVLVAGVGSLCYRRM